MADSGFAPRRRQKGGLACTMDVAPGGQIRHLGLVGRNRHRGRAQSEQGARHSHYGRWPNNAHSGKDFVFPRGTFADFHVYALEWGPARLAGRWMAKSARRKLSGGAAANSTATRGKPGREADLNLAGRSINRSTSSRTSRRRQVPRLNPDKATKFPEMLVDYDASTTRSAVMRAIPRYRNCRSPSDAVPSWIKGHHGICVMQFVAHATPPASRDTDTL